MGLKINADSRAGFVTAGLTVPVAVNLWVVIDVSGRFRVAAPEREATAAVVAAGFLVETGRDEGLSNDCRSVLIVAFTSFGDHSRCFARLDLANESP